MAHTPGIGRTPVIAATRLGTATLAAVGTLALTRWWLFEWAPATTTMMLLFSAGFMVLLGILAVPTIVEKLPARVSATTDAVVIPARRVTTAQPLILAAVLIWLGGVFGSVSGVEGPRGSSPEAWTLVAALCAFGATYLLVQRPWRRRIELRRDTLVLTTGDEASHIPWDDIASIDQAPLLSTARSGPAATRAYNAAAITVVRRSDTRGPRRRRLEDHYPTGDLSCPFPTLLPVLRRLAADPAARDLLADPDRARRLFTGDPTATEQQR